ncbi:Spo11/DNA topoisomerase VI subunit A [Thamnidium elegans]|nr:Spo11/DNA topoisomerase VI subunit A [Thamnidium elegans]
MPHIYLDYEEEEEEVCTVQKQHILDHTTPNRVAEAIPVNQNSTVAKSGQELMSNIQDTIEQVITCIALGEPIKLSIITRSNTSSQTSSQNSKINNHKKTRVLSLSSADAAKTLARYLSVLQMIYEAIAYKIMVTKRDIFYRDVPLFNTQSVSAASKGLIFGPIIIKLKNNKVLDCMSTPTNQDECNDEQGILIPPISQVSQVQCKAKCMIVIEKEGKGYPDLSTRQFAFAFDVLNLAVKDIVLIGLTCQDRIEFKISKDCLIPMTERDKSKLASMVRTFSIDESPGTSQLRDRGWSDDILEQLASEGHQCYM